MEEYKSITDKLHAYEKQWTDMDYTIGHLRQENAELKAEVVGLKNLYRPSISTSVDDLVDDVTGKTRIELQRSLVALEKCREALIGWRKYFQSDLPKTADQQECQGEQFTSAWFDAEEAIKSAESLSSPPNLQPTQDPATAIAYALYPSSARPVNPNPSKSENWVGYTPIDPQTK